MSDEKKEETGLVIPTEVNVRMDVTKEDLIAIKVSTYERDLITKQKETGKTIAVLTKELKTAEDALTDNIQKDCDMIIGVTPGISDILGGMSSLGMEAKATVNPYKAEVLFKSDTDPTPWNIDITCTIAEEKRYGSNISFTCISGPSAETLHIRNSVRDLSDKLDKEKKYSFEIKKSLASISTLERQARAQFAAHALKSSAEGQAVLKNIEGIDDSFLLPEKTA